MTFTRRSGGAWIRHIRRLCIIITNGLKLGSQILLVCQAPLIIISILRVILTICLAMLILSR